MVLVVVGVGFLCYGGNEWGEESTAIGYPNGGMHESAINFSRSPKRTIFWCRIVLSWVFILMTFSFGSCMQWVTLSKSQPSSSLQVIHTPSPCNNFLLRWVCLVGCHLLLEGEDHVDAMQDGLGKM